MTATVITGLAATMHASAAGGVDPMQLLLLWTLLLPATRVVQGAPGALLRTVAWLTGAQLLSHVLLSQHHPGAHSAATGHAMAGHGQMLRRSASALGPQLLASAWESVAALATQPQMLAAHVLAAAGAGWWLVMGERQTAAAARLLAQRVAQWLPSRTIGAPIRLRAAADGVAPRAALLAAPRPHLIPGTVLRGPPVCC